MSRARAKLAALALVLAASAAAGARAGEPGPSTAGAALAAGCEKLGAELAALALPADLRSADEKVHVLVRYVNETDSTFQATWEAALAKALDGKPIVLTTDEDAKPAARARLSLRIGCTKRGEKEMLRTTFELVSIARGEVDYLGRAAAYADKNALAAAGSPEEKALAESFAAASPAEPLARALREKLDAWKPDAKVLGEDKRARVLRSRARNETDKHVDTDELSTVVECAAFASRSVKLLILADPELDLLRPRLEQENVEIPRSVARYSLRIRVVSEAGKLRGYAAMDDRTARSKVLEAAADLPSE